MAEYMIDQSHLHAPSDIQLVLEQRAQALARPIDGDSAGEHVELAVLNLGAELYGVDIRLVQEIRPLSGLAPVPGAPPIWAGLMNLRGQLYPILHLRRYLDLPEQRIAAAGKVVIVAGAGLVVGLLADDVTEVRAVLRSAIAPPLAPFAGGLRASVQGVTADWLTVLDVEALLADRRLIAREAIDDNSLQKLL